MSAVIINRMSSKNICSGWRRAANGKCPLLMNIESLWIMKKRNIATKTNMGLQIK